jgi:hypothetical protein
VLHVPVARRYTKTASMETKSASPTGAAALSSSASAFVPGAAEEDDNNGNNDDTDDIPMGAGIQLVADPPFVASAFSRLDGDRFDRIFLYDLQQRGKQKQGRGEVASDDEADAASSRRRDDDDAKNGSDGNELPRYTVTVVDRGIIAASSSSSGNRHGTVAFLIPAGREAEFMFSTLPGLKAVLESANCDRLLAIATGRGHAFAGGSGQIQQELQTVCQIVHYRRGRGGSSVSHGNSRTATRNPSGRSHGRQNDRRPRADDGDNDTDESSHMIPFVTTSEGVGEREIVARGHSELSGEYVVEQVRGSASDDDGGDGGGGDHDGDETTVARRLYFLSNPFVIQSEVCFRRHSATVDPTMVAFEYHRAMVSCLAGALWRQKKPGPHLAANTLSPTNGDHAFAPDVPPPTIPPQGLLLGLGGGGLLHYARRVLPRTQWKAVELDPEVACIAREHFGVDELVRSGYVDVRIGNALDVRSCGNGGESDDGLAFAAHSLSFIVVDVDAKDNTIGMSCPPSEFVSEGYLRTLAGLLVLPSADDDDDDDNAGATSPSGGMLVVNVSARDPSLFHEACRSLRAVFPHVLAASPGDDSINVVVVASLRELPFAAVGANASASSLILTSSQRPPTLDGPTGSDDAVPPTDLTEEELRRLFDEVRVWDPLGDQSEARAINISSSSNKKNNSKKKKGKSGKKKR